MEIKYYARSRTRAPFGSVRGTYFRAFSLFPCVNEPTNALFMKFLINSQNIFETILSPKFEEAITLRKINIF